MISSDIAIKSKASNSQIASLESISLVPSTDPTSVIQAMPCSVTFFNSMGQVLDGPTRRLIIFPKPNDLPASQQVSLDVSGALFYLKQDSDYQIICIQRVRPALLARKYFGLPTPTPIQSGHVSEGLGTYMRGSLRELSLAASLSSILRETNLEPALVDNSKAQIQLLGTRIVPEPNSPEAVQYGTLEVRPKPGTIIGEILPGEKFLQGRHLKLISPQQLVIDFAEERFFDLRHTLAVLRFAEQKDLEIKLPDPQVSSSVVEVASLEHLSGKIFSPEQIKNFAFRNTNVATSVSAIALPPLEAPEKDYLREAVFKATNNLANQIHSEPYSVETIYTQGQVDVVSNLAFFVHNKELYIWCNIGQRAAQACRDLVAHPYQFRTSAVSIEHCWGQLPDLERQDLKTHAQDLLKQFSLQPVENAVPIRLGCGTISSGFNPALAELFAQQIDPAKSSATPGFFCKAEDLLTLAQTGDASFLNLELSVRLLKLKLADILTPSASPHLTQDSFETSFQNIMSSGGERLKKLGISDPKVFEMVYQADIGRRFIHFIVNECAFYQGGVSVEEGLRNFCATAGVFPLHSLDPSGLMQKVNFHDLFHAACGDAHFDKLEDYQRGVLENEIRAVWFSEVLLPQVCGINFYEGLTGEPSAARVFEKCGLLTAQEQIEALRSLIIEGIVPPKIFGPVFSQESSLELEERKHLQDILIKGPAFGYYARDHANTEVMFNFWKENELIYKIASRFNNRIHHDYQTYFDFLDKTWGEIATYNHGVNPLKAELGQMRALEIRGTALKLAFFLQHLSKGNLPDSHQESFREKANVHLDILEAKYNLLGELKTKVSDAELSDFNRGIWREALAIQNESVAAALHFINEACSKGALNKQAEYEILNFKFPTAISRPFFVSVDMQSVLKDRISISEKLYYSGKQL